MVTLSTERPTGDDVTIRQRVESEVFADPKIDKGRITIDVESGVVILRGELDDPEQIHTIEQAARGVRGVVGVHSLLHHSGTPAPNKAEARQT
jgi:osmotically-inducible protein OsmY